jgi:c-di-GMP-related signal transduction protein
VRAITGNRSVASESTDPASVPRPGVACLVRQPVFNADEDVLGYRLFSSGGGPAAPDGYLAAMAHRAHAELTPTARLDELAPRGVVFLRVSREDFLEQRPLSLSYDRVVLCLRASEPLDDDLRFALDRHSMRGFRLAVDGVDRIAMDGPLIARAQVAIVETGSCSPEQLRQIVASGRDHVRPLTLVAAGVDSRSSFEICQRLDFDMFQGQFFLQRTAGRVRGTAEAGMSGIGTMADLAATDSFERLGAIITRDPGLSLRLLHYANSAHVSLPREVGSVHEAIAWLGTLAVREFALIAALANVPEAPVEMLVAALTRARMSQELGRRLPGTDPERSFTVGLFSVAEVVANAPIEVVLAELPLREDIASALIGGAGELGRLLTAVVAYERGDSDPATILTGAPHLVARTYLDSIRWADSATRAVH